MSPNEQKITPGRAAMASALSMISSGVTQTGQPGPWIISIAVGQQLVDAVPDDRVGLPAADLHHRPGPRGGRVDLVEQPAGQLGVAELVEVLHRLCSRLLRAARVKPSPNSSSRMPSRSKLASVSCADCLVEPLDREADVHDDVLADRARRGCTPGRRPCARRRSRPRPSACRPSRRCSRPVRERPDTCAVSSPRSSQLPAPTDDSWPRAMPAVVGRQQPRAQHGETPVGQQPSRPRRAAPRSGTRRRPARRVAGRSARAARSARSTIERGDRGVEPGGDDAPAARRPRTSATTARITGPGRPRSVAGRSRPMPNAYGRPAVGAAGQPLQLDRRLGLVVDHVPHAGQRGDRVEQPAHAGGRHAAEARCRAGARARRARPCGQAATGGRSGVPRDARRRAGAPAPSGTGAARSRRRRPAARSRGAPTRRKPTCSRRAAPRRPTPRRRCRSRCRRRRRRSPARRRRPVLGHAPRRRARGGAARAHRPAGGVLAGPAGGAVGRVRVGHEHARAVRR